MVKDHHDVATQRSGVFQRADHSKDRYASQVTPNAAEGACDASHRIPIPFMQSFNDPPTILQGQHHQESPLCQAFLLIFSTSDTEMAWWRGRSRADDAFVGSDELRMGLTCPTS